MPNSKPSRLTREQLVSNFQYYGLSGADLVEAVEAYIERVNDGSAPDEGEFAEAWAQLG
jgi:hypothetical protein